MLKLKRILLIAPIEKTRSPAFDRAQALARATGAMLHIVAFDDAQALTLTGLFAPGAIAQALEGYVQMHRHWLEQQARFQRCSGLQVTTEVVWEQSSLAHVLEYVNNFHADLVIKDLLHVPALDRAFHRPLDWLLLRDCPAPWHWVTGARHAKPLRILATLDLSHLEDLTQGLNERILDLASTLAASCGAVLHVLNVRNWSVVGDTQRSLPTLTLADSLRDAVNDAQDEAFDVLAERYGIEKKYRHQLVGIPHQVIEHFAQQNAFDMVVLGTAYHPGADWLTGSTAESVLNHAPCSLMIVKPGC
ncbi:MULTISPECIES: universal stress protein [unclassified Pseudomonas]|uniref:universal stress protein n=1 Tax=unclassified Pseudomonas TaxID=196821 RepID=UPI002AC94485|nr:MULTISPECIES: universal stress protein [unclassified Pseudomonas]MEB0047533.1 universal stress protein [Pseudomonas sp. Dout3]MEB0097976.1 universal stress protein [Pseudomonas sp. DC1.2]WPX61617.1 universal stress protein [Pseudomonas sp. DC1.2]